MLCISMPTKGVLMHSVDPVLPSRDTWLGQIRALVLPNRCYLMNNLGP